MTSMQIFMPKIRHRLAGINLCKEIVFPSSFYAPFIPGFPKTSASLKRLMPKYQFSRAKWYAAKRPGGWNHLGREYHEVLQWCIENFGSHPKQRDAWSRWYMDVETVVFRDEEDYLMFLLRWGE